MKERERKTADKAMTKLTDDMAEANDPSREKFYSVMRNHQRKEQGDIVLKDLNGEPLEDDAEIEELFRTFWEGIFDPHGLRKMRGWTPTDPGWLTRRPS